METCETAADSLAGCLEQLQKLVGADSEEIAVSAMKGAMNIVLRAFLQRGLEGGRAIELVDASVVTPTEAATAACSLIAAFDLTPFDLAMWQTRMNYLSVGENK